MTTDRRSGRASVSRVSTRKVLHSVFALSLALVTLLAATTPAAAITGGTEDLANRYSNVGMVVFYQPDGVSGARGR